MPRPSLASQSRAAAAGRRRRSPAPRPAVTAGSDSLAAVRQIYPAAGPRYAGEPGGRPRRPAGRPVRLPAGHERGAAVGAGQHDGQRRRRRRAGRPVGRPGRRGRPAAVPRAARLADVILVGAGTARAENYRPARAEPLLAGLRQGRPPTPPIAVLSASLDLDPAVVPAGRRRRTRAPSCSPRRPRRPARGRPWPRTRQVIVAGTDTGHGQPGHRRAGRARARPDPDRGRPEPARPDRRRRAAGRPVPDHRPGAGRRPGRAILAARGVRRAGRGLRARLSAGADRPGRRRLPVLPLRPAPDARRSTSMALHARAKSRTTSGTWTSTRCTSRCPTTW